MSSPGGPAPAPARLRGVRAKIERAKHHVGDLQVLEAAFRQSNSYRFVAEKDAKSGYTRFRVEIRDHLPYEFSCVIGDAIHNLRTALDHLVWQLVLANKGKPNKRHAFPFYETAAEYKRKRLAK